jgi:hypothetical protein
VGAVEYDFEDLQERWRQASKAASLCASDGEEEPHAALGLFLGSLIEELTEAVEEAGVPAPADGVYVEDDREVPVHTGPIVLKGRNPVSILHEVCQSRGWSNPVFETSQTGESHVPVFNGSVAVNDGSEGDTVVHVEGAKSKADLKKALAKKMLITNFGAQEDY